MRAKEQRLAKIGLTDRWKGAPPAGSPVRRPILQVEAINICKDLIIEPCNNPRPGRFMFVTPRRLIHIDTKTCRLEHKRFDTFAR